MPLAGFSPELAFQRNIFLQHWILLLNSDLFFALIVVCTWMEQTERMQGSKTLSWGLDKLTCSCVTPLSACCVMSSLLCMCLPVFRLWSESEDMRAPNLILLQMFSCPLEHKQVVSPRVCLSFSYHSESCDRAGEDQFYHGCEVLPEQEGDELYKGLERKG